MKVIPEGHPLRRLFRWATRKAIHTSSTSCPPEAEKHLSEEILAKFVHIDNLYWIRNSRGKRVYEIAEMLLEGERLSSFNPRLKELYLHQYIGDYALFITGLFPESLKNIYRQPESKDYLLMKMGTIVVPFSSPLDYYREQGRISYGKVAGLYQGINEQKSRLFTDLSLRFETYMRVMNLTGIFLEASPYFLEARRIWLER